MITSLNEWRKRKAAGTLNEVASVNTASDFQQIKSLPAPIENELAIDNNDLFDQIRSVAEYAKDFDLSKIDTIGIIQKIFVDPAQAPDDISVAFVQMHLGQIVSIIDQMPDEDFPENPLTFSADMKANDLPFECVMYIPNNKTITKLVEALNVQIKKDNFKTIYENGVFFINSLEKMNENNRSKVMNILKECNAKNIGKQLKWKRKLQ